MMIKGNFMSLYKVVLTNGEAFFLSACSQRQAECFALNLTPLSIASVVLQDD